MFTSVKIAGPYDDVKIWHEKFMDSSKPNMLVRHVEGKKKELHFHSVGVPVDNTKDAHLHFDKDTEFEHPLRKQKKKPFRTKNQKYDEEHFKYLVKPKEWGMQGAEMVLMTSFSQEEIEDIVKQSEEYFAKLKDIIPMLIEKLPMFNGQGEPLEPQEFHSEAMYQVLNEFMRQKKDPGPWVTHKVRMAVYKRSITYRPYICKKYM